MNPTNPEVDTYLNNVSQWQAEFRALRSILLGCDVVEEYKWEQPCYSWEGHNVVLIHGFHDFCALLFMKGSLLKDPESILIQQTEHVQAARQIRFTSLDDIRKLESVIRIYVSDAIAIEKLGLKVEYKDTADYPMPEELIAKLEEVPGLQDAFDALTPGRQRGYLLFFSAPKQSKTRIARIEKYTPLIFEGKGINDLQDRKK